MRLALGLLMGIVFGVAARAAKGDAVYAWGLNNFGQLGDDSASLRSTPTALSVLGNGVTGVAAGEKHSLAVRDGGVYAWGYNDFGQVGVGTTTSRYTPIALSALGSGVTDVAAGGLHSLALRNGAVYAWGQNIAGALGDGTTARRDSPVAIAALNTDVTDVAAGSGHSLALRNGAVYAWGSNYNAQLGDGTTSNIRTSPTAVSALSSGVTAIAAGANFNLAVKDGAVFAWGVNTVGQLGNGTTGENYTYAPVAVTTLSFGVTAVAAGAIHGLAVRDGAVYAWGYNYYGEIGDGTNTLRATPVQIDPTNLHDIVAVAATSSSSYALSADGSLWVWGNNFRGELGLGNATNQYRTPQHLLPPVGYRYTAIEASSTGEHALATVAPVPEPGSIWLLGVGGLALLRRRGRRG